MTTFLAPAVTVCTLDASPERRLLAPMLLWRRRYESALQKANYASLALKEDPSAAVGEEEDEELYHTLARARRAAQAKSTQAVCVAARELALHCTLVICEVCRAQLSCGVLRACSAAAGSRGEADTGPCRGGGAQAA